MNWIERRWTREQNLVNGGPKLWQAVTVALDNCCASFRQHYSDLGNATFEQQNGHRILVTVHRKYAPSGTPHEVAIQFIYEPGPNRISVVVGYISTPKHFVIESDETHAFIRHSGKEISTDDFSRLVLEDIFFVNVKEARASQGPSGGPGGPDAWMS